MTLMDVTRLAKLRQTPIVMLPRPYAMFAETANISLLLENNVMTET